MSVLNWFMIYWIIGMCIMYLAIFKIKPKSREEELRDDKIKLIIEFNPYVGLMAIALGGIVWLPLLTYEIFFGKGKNGSRK